jgi:hypothetical protein
LLGEPVEQTPIDLLIDLSDPLKLVTDLPIELGDWVMDEIIVNDS